MKQYHYVIIGAGRQGTSAAYDLIQHGEAASVRFLDMNLEQAQKAADRVKHLTDYQHLSAAQIDVRDQAALQEAISGADVALSAVPYFFNVSISKAAIVAGVSLVDMGGHTGVVKEQLALDAEAQAAGITLLPDCGMGPGLINTLACYTIELLDETRSITIYDGGLPQEPEPPWNYELAFHINGLTNEYDGDVDLIRDGQIVAVEALSELKTVNLPGVGEFESFIAAGGSTGPWTFEGLLDHFETRIIRYPGHYVQFRAFRDLGFFGLDPIQVNGQSIVPREVYHTLLAPQIIKEDIRDVCYMQCHAIGKKDGAEAQVRITLIDRYDDVTGFRGMERLTGWHCAIHMHLIAKGQIPPGAAALEALHLKETPSASHVLEAFALRGIPHEISWQ